MWGPEHHFEYVNLWPRPYQDPHPPIWIPSQGSSETIEWAAHPDRRYTYLQTFSPVAMLARYMQQYKDQAREFGYEASEEQLGWAVEEGVDFVIAETNDYVGEALIALEVCTELGLSAMVTFASVQPSSTYDGYPYVEACRILADAGAALVGLNCSRGPETMLPLLDPDAWLVLDAFALPALVELAEVSKPLHPRLAVTPNPKEAALLLERVCRRPDDDLDDSLESEA